MKNFFLSIILFAAFGVTANALENNHPYRFQNVNQWKVGDTLIYKIEATRYKDGVALYTDDVGYSSRQVTYDTGDAFWACGEMGYSFSKDIKVDCNPVQQFLVRKSDGVVIKEYSGLNGMGLPMEAWITDSVETASLSVPLGQFVASHNSGRYYPDFTRADVWPMQKWYADKLPMDGLIQLSHTDGPDRVMTFKLVKVIFGQGKR